MSKSKNILYVFGSKLLIFLFTILKGLLVPVYLGPKMYGVLNTIGLVKTILRFTDFGFDKAYLRLRLSILGEGGDKDRLLSLQNTVFTVLSLSGFIGAAITLTIPWFLRLEEAELVKVMHYGFAITAFEHILLAIGGFYTGTCVSQKRFSLRASLNVLQVFLNIILLLAMVFVWQIYGVWIAELIAILVVQIIYFIKTDVKARFTPDWQQIREVGRYALPFCFTKFSFYLAQMIDKTVILRYLTFGELGLYSFALNIAFQSQMAYKAIIEVLSPYFMEDMGEKTDAMHLSDKIMFHIRSLALVSSIGALNSILFCDILGLLVPKYSASMFTLKVLFINSYVVTVPLYQSYILGAPGVRKQNWNNASMVVAGILNWTVSVFLINKGWGINGVAVGTLVSTCIWKMLQMILAHRYYQQTWNLPFYFKIGWPVLGLCCITLYRQCYPLHFDASFAMLTILSNVLLIIFFRTEIRELWPRIKNKVKSLKGFRKLIR